MIGFENIFNKDMADVPYIIDEAEMERYINTTKHLKKLAAQGKLELEYEDPATAFRYHSVSIKWNLIDELVSIEFSDLRDILLGQGGSITILPYDSTEWLITYKIYA